MPSRRRTALLLLGGTLLSLIVAAALAAISWPVLAVVAVLVAVGLAIWLIPRRQVAGWRKAEVNSAELPKLEMDARTSIIQAIGGFALVLTLAITAYQVNETRRSADENLRVVEQGQVTERFARAIEQLGARSNDGTPAVEIRIGALLSLMRIGLDSSRDTEPALLVVASYVETNHRRSRRVTTSPACVGRRGVRADVEVAVKYVLSALARKALSRRGGVAYVLRDLDFSETDLSSADFSGAVLRDVSFRCAELEGAVFSRALLVRTDFRNADLSGADFRRAFAFRVRTAGASLFDTKGVTRLRDR